MISKAFTGLLIPHAVCDIWKQECLLTHFTLIILKLREWALDGADVGIGELHVIPNSKRDNYDTHIIALCVCVWTCSYSSVRFGTCLNSRTNSVYSAVYTQPTLITRPVSRVEWGGSSKTTLVTRTRLNLSIILMQSYKVKLASETSHSVTTDYWLQLATEEVALTCCV
jgi:hypothetical protein